MNFQQFIDSPNRNAWVREKGISLYVRKGIKKGVDFDLANMAADKPGNNSLTTFLDKWESEYCFLVENIFNERLIPYLMRRGYHFYNGHTDPQCMIGVKRD